MGFCIFVALVLCLAPLLRSTSAALAPLNVLDYGAVGNGKEDDSNAFLRGWDEVCNSTISRTLLIPSERTFLVQPLMFQGPCRARGVSVQIDGNIIAPTQMSKFDNVNTWIQFHYVDGLNVYGSGQIDGQGSVWWRICTQVLSFAFCNGLYFRGLTLINAPSQFISLFASDYSTISNLHISAPGTTRNTDGINISNSKNVMVMDSTIGSGDDCISILPPSSNINITGITCGPGHGISVGSIGKDGEYGEVENVYVTHSTFTSVTSGARIKTWQGGKGFVRKILYQDIKLVNSSDPIVIDQFYCPERNCANKTDAVAVSDISFIGFSGTSSSDVAVDISCSQNLACKNIIVRDISITSGVPNRKVYAEVFNAYGNSYDTNPQVQLLRN
ncbi:hypothetical protein K2173_005214 [Erythroxylum novogranatense]|uniref:Polygalacturonase n=1 Tax=Erythroxylum novogranatense TaxID=1862640 RepID=A0AAV8TRP7_9ROSI|nr:hypothetical protein K2173_005214 [Erythroxylum novogranatense]